MDDQGANRAGGGIRFRKLRIAWSAVFGILCLLLIVLWVRDYLDTGEITSLPYAFPTLISFGLALAAWAGRPTRFSLRTLLIGMTLIAAVLGFVVWTANS